MVNGDGYVGIKTLRIIKRGIAAIVVLCFIVGCATSPDKISATYISPLQYQSYSCNQLGEELLRVNRRVVEISGQQRSEATKDAVALGVGLVVFWPALFFMIGKDQKEELGRLKGEYEAIEQAAMKMECSLAEQLQEAKRQRDLDQKKRKAESEKTRDELNTIDEGF